jgi:hypothetical protein
MKIQASAAMAATTRHNRERGNMKIYGDNYKVLILTINTK